jgi:predicted FMN-binding regulatory protein PaiB
MGDTAREMAGEVVAFRLRASTWHAEARLSQDEPGEERAHILAGLQRPGVYANPTLAEVMRTLGG